MRHLTERRWNFRKPLNSGVILNSLGIRVIQAETRDVSYGGMRVDTAPLVLSPNSKVRVTFVMREGAWVTRRAIDARVAYTNGRGCGLVFEEFHRDTFSFLHRLMHPETEVAASRRGQAAGHA